ncbi:hypothetical protein FAZ15_21860 [Sphingobacterium olei]|uniref:Uncharacterized protein n=1 Tax=Sphingobacterium olei TaxID=2571155 RepID=A0A4U0N8E5_9SPHI|nr:hypothetical protein [Sphingobacterium olei]TJZ50065.1 hypothetical protein FAZ15_21860 [Sphingobacterium olei]
MATFQLNNPNAPGSPSSYSLGNPGCDGNNQICTIEADNVGGAPDITDDLKNEMLEALNTRNNTDNVTLKS